MMQWLMIAIGGALGSMARFAAVGYLTPMLNYRFPIGTFIVNIVGSFLIGVAYVVLVEKAVLPSEWRLFFINPENGIIIAPYDGGVDLIFADEKMRHFYKKKYINWLSEREDGF